MSTLTDYQLPLPVFKQGDDLRSHMETHVDDARVFLAMANQYEEAARICRRMAGVIKESGREKEIEIDGDAHMISISGPPEVFAGLVSDKVLFEVDYDDYMGADADESILYSEPLNVLDPTEE